jgi:hypothetical protein
MGIVNIGFPFWNQGETEVLRTLFKIGRISFFLSLISKVPCGHKLSLLLIRTQYESIF